MRTEGDGQQVWQARDHNGTRTIWARFDPVGGLRIAGQDLGPGVKIWGPDFTEYEWDWSATADQLPAAIAALGGEPGDDVIEVLRAWIAANGGSDPGLALQKAGIVLEFWSRVGE